MHFITFLLIFGGHKSFFWGDRYSCFEFLVTSPLGFKVTEGFRLKIWKFHRTGENL